MYKKKDNFTDIVSDEPDKDNSEQDDNQNNEETN